MLKSIESVKQLENRAASALGELIEQVPAIRVENIGIEAHHSRREIDILARINVSDRPRILVCEVKANGQPRHVRAGLLQLRNHAAHFGGDAIPILIAPYLSPEAQALCKENRIGFLDLIGNARLVFDSVFIERRVPGRPSTEHRQLRSLFKPKSARVLRAMLRDPKREWRVIELADAAGVSLGHVSNVRTSLLEREWAQISERGLFLSEPGALLNAWRDEYEPPRGKRLAFYTTLHGAAFEEAARQTLIARSDQGNAVLASFSAAHWLAPYGRTGTPYFYADNAGMGRLKQRLKLSPSPKGENVVVTVPEDDGLFFDIIEPAAGAVCTSAIQTYLDLWAAGERGQEAAEHLRQEMLSWPK